ncbi:DUF4314 domain-containing protein [Nocardia abscessus]|uniref:DUF4314 domain-containing protein n=1 Tax=Nocardia abscessus TaxID=120957 RepID=UPI0018932068|nr:DUF4314 domain-containing protein [Nocardia abscessus]MBF6341267.1 DUF4314 domain-containing protein [Nocardia abscessus]
MPWPDIGDRVRITGTMPEEKYPLEIDATGTVKRLDPAVRQIDVRWDNGRRLMLLETDPFEIIPAEVGPVSSGDMPDLSKG